jgi:hypothetical protein
MSTSRGASEVLNNEDLQIFVGCFRRRVLETLVLVRPWVQRHTSSGPCGEAMPKASTSKHQFGDSVSTRLCAVPE